MAVQQTIDCDEYAEELDLEAWEEGHWQAVHPKWSKMSVASCHVAFVAWRGKKIRATSLVGAHYSIGSEVSQ